MPSKITRQVLTRKGFGILRHLFWWPHRHHPAPSVATLRPEINDPVGGFNHIQIMLDHQDRITLINQPLEHVEQMTDIGRVKPGGRFI